jgi:hypothetical protein
MTTILEDVAVAKRAAEQRANRNEARRDLARRRGGQTDLKHTMEE